MKITINKGSRGGIELFLVGIIVIGAFFLVGGVGLFKKSPSTDSVGETKILCCDSGNGDSCVPNSTDTVTYNGAQYGRLRSQTKFVEGNLHLKDSGAKTATGEPIILNSSDADDNFADLPLPSACSKSGNDKYLTEVPKGVSITNPAILAYCRETLNDQIIYVCKKNCVAAATCPVAGYGIHPPTCYGNQTTEYDAYFRLNDYPSPGVPDFIKNCSEKTSPTQLSGDKRLPQEIVIPNNEPHDNLQLNTFTVKEPGGQAIPWFSPFCKPAIYLYPEKVSQVSVKVSPVGPFTYTDPLYPKDGWNITAYPDGKIISNTSEFPYLYYEADIPSVLIPKPDTGFSVKGNNMETFLSNLLPQLGLNSKETTEMADYWKNSLPNSPYYFVGIIPESVLDSIAPLSIHPKPKTTIRVALYFEEQKTPETVKKPTLSNKKRLGFTAVEWGGILKTDKPFTCLQ